MNYEEPGKYTSAGGHECVHIEPEYGEDRRLLSLQAVFKVPTGEGGKFNLVTMKLSPEGRATVPFWHLVEKAQPTDYAVLIDNQNIVRSVWDFDLFLRRSDYKLFVYTTSKKPQVGDYFSFSITRPKARPVPVEEIALSLPAEREI